MRKNLLITAMAILAIASVATLVVRAQTTSVETAVRIVAQKLDDGRVEFGIQQREQTGEWGERILPSSRYFPTTAPANRWLRSTAIPLTVDVPATSAAAAPQASGNSGLTRANPAPLGNRVRVGDWEVRVFGTMPDGTAAVMAENQFNDPPRTGWQFHLVEVEVTYRGAGSQTPWLYVDFAGLGQGNALRDNSCGVIPDDLDDQTELFTGGSIRGNICFEAQSSEVDAGGMVLVVDGSKGGSILDQDRVYLALE